jgi:hypothetical protein
MFMKFADFRASGMDLHFHIIDRYDNLLLTYYYYMMHSQF